jgi:hypothetical protein
MSGWLIADAITRSPAHIPWLHLGASLAVVGITLGLLAFAWRWLRDEKEEPTVTSNDLLSEFRKMRDEGTMSPAEFDRVRAKLGNKIRTEHGQPPIAVGELPPLPPEEGDFEWNEIDLKKFNDSGTAPKPDAGE